MSIVILIYIASIVENLKMFLLIIAGIFSVLTFFACASSIDITTDIGDFFNRDNKSIKVIKRFVICAVTTGFFAVIIPTERQVYYISAAYVGINVADNTATSPEFNKIRLIINNKMDEYIKENNIKDAEIAQ